MLLFVQEISDQVEQNDPVVLTNLYSPPFSCAQIEPRHLPREVQQQEHDIIIPMTDKSRVLVVRCGGVGTIAALNLERGNLAEVSCVLRSNYELVKEAGYTIHSCYHGELRGWRPTER